MHNLVISNPYRYLLAGLPSSCPMSHFAAPYRVVSCAIMPCTIHGEFHFGFRLHTCSSVTVCISFLLTVPTSHRLVYAGNSTAQCAQCASKEEFTKVYLRRYISVNLNTSSAFDVGLGDPKEDALSCIMCTIEVNCKL